MQASAYKTTIDYLFKQLPMFHRIGAAAYKANLNNTHALMQLLNQPQQGFKSIHVAGTNGKGSTSHMLASILQHAGYKVGLYTSPHLNDFRERIKINGKPISKKYVIDFVETYKADFEKIQPSFFEWTVGLCFDYFRNQQIDIAVIETGLGGRLDSTNVITPLLSVITNIGYDHMALLGNTLPEIASEKAGIIKSKTPVVIGKYQNSTAPVFKLKAKSENAPINFASKILHADLLSLRNGLQFVNITAGKNLRYKKLALDLTGTYQLENVTTVLAAVAKLQSNFNINEIAIRNGLKTVVKTTGLMGRWQTIQTKPLIICDTGHNVDGITYVLKNMESIKYKKLHIVIGIVADKDVSHILKRLP
ncbi:MAG TPA: Mur ligase family protein, partial [Bacteroidia bacterium]|nr:Mur ligase family protein [Bacteroidia bacterium]